MRGLHTTGDVRKHKINLCLQSLRTLLCKWRRQNQRRGCRRLVGGRDEEPLCLTKIIKGQLAARQNQRNCLLQEDENNGRERGIANSVKHRLLLLWTSGRWTGRLEEQRWHSGIRLQCSSIGLPVQSNKSASLNKVKMNMSTYLMYIKTTYSRRITNEVSVKEIVLTMCWMTS